MTDFEREWHDRYMSNMTTLITLQKLVAAQKLTQEMIDEWVAERQEIYGV